MLCIYRDLWRIEICVVNSAAGKVSPARRQPLFDGLERYIKIDDLVHAVVVIQGLGLGHSARKTYKQVTQTVYGPFMCICIYVEIAP